MSKFLDAVEAKITGRKTAPMWPLEPVSVTQNVKEIAFTLSNQYDIGVHWKVRVTCAPDDLQNMLRNVKQQLRMAIYGEFREVLLRLERALYENDRKSALHELTEAFKKIEL